MMYEGKLILAPMVRVGTLPMRMLALEYGAGNTRSAYFVDLVYSPETVDKKLIGCDRIINERLGTVDYVWQGKELVLRLSPQEKSRLIVQLGTADPQLALQAALRVKDDVAGIDLNCGCPKRFSIQAGMGAALLREPERLESILKTLVEGLGPHGIPVSAKIRIFDEAEETLSLVRRICATGIVALAVHCRTPAERPHQPAHWDRLAAIAQAAKPIPLIANGDCFQPADIHRLFGICGIKAVMIARGAQWNASIFHAHRQGTTSLLPLSQVSIDYLRWAHRLENPFGNTKYTLLQMWIGQGAKHEVSMLQSAKTYTDLAAIWQVQLGADGEIGEQLEECVDY